jgi:ribosomal protein S18 acetylase RimI-like enzyme
VTEAGRSVALRPAEAGDLAFLWEMLAVAASWREADPMPVEEVRADAGFARYLSGWGRAGDLALVAVEAGERVGAVWGRLFTAAEHGYGYVSPEVPEISVGVLGRARGRGVGTALLEAFAAEARERGFGALSLSVERGNPAFRLYERAGFRTVGTSDGSDWIMRLELG